jgi:hypothetical protein
MKQLLFAVLALSLLVPAVPMAHPGHEHKLMGTISSIDKNIVVMKTTDGETVTLEILPITTFKKGAQKGSQADLKAGMRIAVSATENGKTMRARDVQYSAPASTAKQ